MISFTKMHGIGNDFVMIDAVSGPAPDMDLSMLAREMCDRHFGVGADGLILAHPGIDAPFQMRMFNPDGSESEMCGNGIRCFALFARDRGLTTDDSIPVETGAGKLTVEICDHDRVRVDMGPARLLRGEIGMIGEPGEPFTEQPIGPAKLELAGTAVSMGNPHVVIFVQDVASVPVEEWGPILEHDPQFPQRVNAHFVQVVQPGEIIQRTWERGAGITLACGTGACACAVAAHVTGRSGRETHVHLPGGELDIEYLANGHVMMTGPAVTVNTGVWLN